MEAPPAKRPLPTGSTVLPICFAVLLTLTATIVLSLFSGFPSASNVFKSRPAHADIRHEKYTTEPPVEAPNTVTGASLDEQEKDADDNEDNYISSQTRQICPNIILISAARHGSTWFVDSASSCMYSAGLDGTYKEDVFKKTEIWTGRVGPVLDISPSDALKYVKRNSSVKFMQTTLRVDKERAEELLRLAKRDKIPVVVLRRRAVEAYRSRSEAHDRGDWRASNYKIGESARREEMKLDEEKEKQLKKFEKSLEKHFWIAEMLLDRVGNSMVDRFDYDDVKNEEFIHAEHSNCYIRNCNYAED